MIFLLYSCKLRCLALTSDVIYVIVLQLDCRAEGNDIISYRWTKDRDTIAVLKNNGALVIDKVSRKHGGTYECLARNGAGTSKAATKATLVVKGMSIC